MKYRLKKFLVWLLCFAMTFSPVANAAASDADHLNVKEMLSLQETEMITELSTETILELVTEAVQKPVAEVDTAAVQENVKEVLTEVTTEPAAEKAQELTTEMTIGATTEATGTETSVEEAQTETVTETMTEEAQTEIVTETMTEEAQAETVTETLTEDAQTEIVTETMTEDAQTETVTETLTEVTQTEDVTESSTEVDQTETLEVLFTVDDIVVTALETGYEVNLGTPDNSFSKIYIGKKEDAEKTPEYIGTRRENGGYEFCFEVSGDVLGQEICIVPYMTEEAEWYTEEDVKITVPSEVIVPETLVMEETAAVEETVELNAEEAAEPVYTDGDYSIEVESYEKMFKVVNCVLNKENGKYNAEITLSGTGYDYLYMGSAADAVTAGKDAWIAVKDTVKYLNANGEEKTGARYVIPVEKLDTPIAVAAHSVKNDNWLDRTLTFKSETIKEVEKTLENGDYNVSVETGEAMFKVIHAVLTNQDGKMIAEITLSGTGYDYLYMGSSIEAENADSTAWIGVKDTVKYTNADGEEKTGARYIIPVCALDVPIQVSSHAIKSGKWVDRTLTFTSTTLDKIENEETETETDSETETETESDIGNNSGTPDDATAAVDHSTTLADGVYTPENFSFSGGSGRTKITCVKVTVKDGKSYVTIQFSSSSYDYVKAAGYKFNKINTGGNSTFEIPVQLNADNIVIGNTTAMGSGKEITYTIHPLLSESAETEKETETESEQVTEKETEAETEKEAETEESVQVDTNKMQNGDYRVQVDSSAAMFRVIDCVLTYKDGVMTAKITLSGTGYDKLFMGTSADAANAADAQKIGFTENAEGKYVFEVPVSALDVPISVAAHSKKNDTWYDRSIVFNSKGMTLINPNEETEETEKETENKKENNKADKESSYESDLSGGTGRVDSSTGLKDGVYTPDKFSWSGGSGRTSISCSKVTVSGGQAYATIVFSSSSYSYVKANGNKYFPSYGAGTSSFTIPVKLNANNTIIGMTTAMSAAHEITYTIYVYIAGADKKVETAENVNDTNKLSEKAPEIIGLEYADEAVIEYAEYFKMYYYDQDITLIEIDMTTDADDEEDSEDVSKESEETTEETGEEQEMEAAEETELKDENTLIAELYQNQIVKYLLVPEDVEIPVGLDKEMIVINLPAESVYTDSVQAKERLKEMELEEIITVENEESAEKPEYKNLILEECDLAILSDDFLEDEEQTELLYEVAERLTTLGIPAIVDRSEDEESEDAQAEWQMIYEELFR